ncbi:GH14311 [Drosophila grimshawi]|uniref:GH14311 n=2 Tax=Drosophila grimshawi TaxID=7222 RepID=B4JYK7_DROGR|nr:GH14311 [Drosophila grimshawi]
MYEDSDSIADNETEEHLVENQNSIPPQQSTDKRRSYVWSYFSTVPEHSDVYRCKVCSETFGSKTTILGRHLQTAHGITDLPHPDDAVKKGRPNRSFVWNFCTKLDEKRALCHICKKVLYFGGGNTSNITKHLRRMHAEKLEEVAKQLPRVGRWGSEAPFFKKERKSSSYVWNYCEKLTKNTVLCKLCNRRMRFHGTANVITHLQRRHDIMDETTPVKIGTPEKVLEAATSSTTENPTPRSSRRNSSVSGSLVWRYITRISDDTVRCRVCLKNLSYQGTSNLQRHLHRMHNIVWNGRETASVPPKSEPHQADSNTFFDFCEATSDVAMWKCQMCEEHFEHNDSIEDAISKHMIRIHGAAIRGDDFSAAEDELHDDLGALYTEVVDDDDANTTAEHVTQQEQEDDVVNDDVLYNDIIEIEEELNNNAEEDGEQYIESGSFANSLSVQSGDNVVSDYSNDSTDAQLVTTTIQADDTPVMRELKENLLRQQAMYFSEKASFYRMQKFLVAQQVRKERLEIEKLKAAQEPRENPSVS